jgi:signal peptidase II
MRHCASTASSATHELDESGESRKEHELRLSIPKRILLPGAALCIVLVDQLSKRWIITHLQFGDPWNPIAVLRSVVSLTYVTNTGAAFGLFPEGSIFFVGVEIAAIIGILIYGFRLPAAQWLVELSLGLMLGGATGNLLDRLSYGHVIDFIDFKVWPVFNVADSSIFIGTMILVIYLWRDREQSEQD